MQTIPNSMRAAQAVDYDDVRLVQLDVPRPGPGEALVRVRVCGICAGDVTPWYIRKKCPIVVGHEPAGDIVAIGEGVTDFAVGDRVFIHHHAPCGECRHCQRGLPSMCSTWRSSQLLPGGLAEYCLVPEVNLRGDTLKLPAELGYDEYFLRLWEFYLCYCEGGFMERTIGTAQLLLAKPAAINPPLLGRFSA